MKILVTYIISDIYKSIGFEWTAIELRKKGIELKFVLLNKTNDSEFQKFLVEHHFKVIFIQLKSKIDYPVVFIKLIYYLIKNKPFTIHTHLRNADILGQLVGFILRIKKRITTRHSSTFNHQYFPQAVKWDKFVNYLATDIVSISNATKNTLVKLEHVNELKIKDISHGFDLKVFSQRNEEKIQILKNKYQIQNSSPVIGVISRYIEWKGIEFTIRAFKNLLDNYPNAKLILANANGEYKSKIHAELAEIPQENFIEIPFENDIVSLYQLFDIFVHVPTDNQIEAFGQIYIESLASRIPSVFTKSGIGNDICINKENCMVVDYKNSEEIYYAILELVRNHDLKNKLVKNGIETVKPFELNIFIDKLEKLYLS